MEQPRLDLLHAEAQDQFETRFHALEGEPVERPRFITARRLLESDAGLGDVAGRMNVPGADQRGPEQMEVLALHVENSRSERPQHPFVGVGGQKIDVPYIDRGRPERLDGIENAAPVEFLGDRLVIETEPA